MNKREVTLPEHNQPDQKSSKKDKKAGKKAEKANKKKETRAEKIARDRNHLHPTNLPLSNIELIQEPKSRKGECVFCEILNEPNKPKVLYEDKTCFAFLDRKKKSAKEHILVCPKEHIKSTASLRDESHIDLLYKLQVAGEFILERDFPKDKHRFGYHAAPLNSVNHLHLHCLVLPITQKFYDEVIYGQNLTSTQALIDKLKGKENHKEKSKSKEEQKDSTSE